MWVQTLGARESTARTNDSMEMVSCFVCNDPSSSPYRVLAGFQFVRCRQCGFVYMNPRPAASRLAALYDASYFQSDDPKVGYPVYEADRPSFRDKSLRLLRPIEQRLGPGRLLDIGCAHGYLLEVAKERNWDVVGIEPAAEVAERVSRRLDVPIYPSLHEARLEGGSFDVVAAWDVIEHVPDPFRLLVECRRLIRANGVCSIVTPDVGSLAARFLGDSWEEMRKMPEHIYFFDRATLARILDRAGFAPLSWGTVGKLMRLSEASERMMQSRPTIFGPLHAAVKLLGLSKTTLYLDPRWKMSVEARRVGRAEDPEPARAR